MRHILPVGGSGSPNMAHNMMVRHDILTHELVTIYLISSHIGESHVGFLEREQVKSLQAF